jgi:transcriptional regulator of acetoin/glycerol metabolism
LHVVRSGGTRAPLQDVEKEHILSVLRDVDGNRVAAAKVLGISRRALYRRLARHRLAEGTLHAVPGREDGDRTE